MFNVSQLGEIDLVFKSKNIFDVGSILLLVDSKMVSWFCLELKDVEQLLSFTLQCSLKMHIISCDILI